MGSIVFTLPEAEDEKLRAKAKSLGLTVSAYLRTLVRDSLKRNPDAPHTELLKAIRALVPTLAEAFGRTQNASTDQTQKLAEILLKRYEQS